jgi:hypothetical protein
MLPQASQSETYKVLDQCSGIVSLTWLGHMVRIVVCILDHRAWRRDVCVVTSRTDKRLIFAVCTPVHRTDASSARLARCVSLGNETWVSSMGKWPNAQ